MLHSGKFTELMGNDYHPRRYYSPVVAPPERTKKLRSSSHFYACTQQMFETIPICEDLQVQYRINDLPLGPFGFRNLVGQNRMGLSD